MAELSWHLGVGLERHYVMLVTGPCFAAVQRADLGRILMPAALWPCCKAVCGCPPLPRSQPNDYKWRWERRQNKAGSSGVCVCVCAGGGGQQADKRAPLLRQIKHVCSFCFCFCLLFYGLFCAVCSMKCSKMYALHCQTRVHLLAPHARATQPLSPSPLIAAGTAWCNAINWLINWFHSDFLLLPTRLMCQVCSVFGSSIAFGQACDAALYFFRNTINASIVSMFQTTTEHDVYSQS